MDRLVVAKSLVKRFDDVQAVDHVDLDICRGEVIGFLGPNGAGKSTTMKMIAGFLTPDKGGVEICGINMLEDAAEAKKKIGYLPEGAPTYGEMSCLDFLEFIAHMRGFSGDDARKRVIEVAEKTALLDVLHREIDTFSKGYKRRVGLAQAILHDPEVLILDEPTDGLDPNQKRHVRELIQQMAINKAIIISTHILEEVEAICNRVNIIAAGRIVADGTVKDLTESGRSLEQVFYDITVTQKEQIDA